MRRFLPAAASALALIGTAHASVVTRDAIADTYVRGGSASGVNYGSDTFLRAERSESVDPQRLFRAILVRFGVGSAGGIEDATLHLTQFSDGAQQVQVFGATDGLDGWDEAAVTYDSAAAAGLLATQTFADLGTVALTTGGAGGALTLTGAALDAFLNAAGADGLVTFVMVSALPLDRTGARFASRENGDLDGPMLSYTQVPLPGALALFAPALGLLAWRRAA